MTQRDVSDCTAIWISGFATGDRARLSVELIRPGRRPFVAHDVELVEGDCELGALLALISS